MRGLCGVNTMTDELDALEMRLREPTLRSPSNLLPLCKEAADALASLRRQLADAEKDYFNAVVKNTIYRQERDSLQSQLAETSLELKTVYADYFTERELRKRYQQERAQLSDTLNGEPCAEIRWQDERAALRSEIDSLQSQLTAERERADSIAQESAETLVQAEKWEVSCGEQTRRLGTALMERDTAQAEARELREQYETTISQLQAIGEEFGVLGGEPRTSGIRRVLTEMQTEARELRGLLKEARAFFRKYDWPPDILARIDAKLTEGA
jgi:chromosome segregation ATPase